LRKGGLIARFVRYGDEAETMEQAIFCTSSNSWLNRVEGQLKVGLQ
jgi:hypothetical protein